MLNQAIGVKKQPSSQTTENVSLQLLPQQILPHRLPYIHSLHPHTFILHQMPKVRGSFLVIELRTNRQTPRRSLPFPFLQLLHCITFDLSHIDVINAKFLPHLGFQGGEEIVLRQILYPRYENAAVEICQWFVEHISYRSGDDGEGGPTGEVVAGAVDAGAASWDVEAGEAVFEPWRRCLVALYSRDDMSGGEQYITAKQRSTYTYQRKVLHLMQSRQSPPLLLSPEGTLVS